MTGLRGASALVALLATLSLVTGCGADDEGPTPLGADATASASPSATVPSGVPTQAPAVPAGLEDSQRGATAYAGYFAELYRYAQARNDYELIAAELDSSGVGSCTRCAEVEKRLDERAEAARFEVPSKPTTNGKVTFQGSNSKGSIVSVQYALAPGNLTDAEGEAVEKIPGQDYFMQQLVRWSEPRGRWFVVDFDVEEAETR